MDSTKSHRYLAGCILKIMWSSNAIDIQCPSSWSAQRNVWETKGLRPHSFTTVSISQVVNRSWIQQVMFEFLTHYPLVICYIATQNDDFPSFLVCLPEGLWLMTTHLKAVAIHDKTRPDTRPRWWNAKSLFDLTPPCSLWGWVKLPKFYQKMIGAWGV